jgi:hypothetical protein
MEELAAYIAGEMNRNIQHPAVLKMKALINYDSSAQARKSQALPWYARLAGPPNFNSIALAKKLEAMAVRWLGIPILFLAMTRNYWCESRQNTQGGVTPRSELAPGGVPTKNLRAPRLSRKHAFSLTSIASKLAPTVSVDQGAAKLYQTGISQRQKR